MTTYYNQSIVWTVLPNGMTNLKADDTQNGFKAGVYFDFSVIISPRLESTASTRVPLYTFPDWQKDPTHGTGRTWPETIHAIAPKLTLNLPGLTGKPHIHARFAPSIQGELFGSQQPDAARWAAMFPNTGDNTTVIPFLFKGLKGRKIRSAPVGAICNEVAQMYGSHGIDSPTAFPTYQALTSTFGRLGFNDVPEGNTAASASNGRDISGEQRLKLYNDVINGALGSRSTPAVPGDPTALANLVKSTLGHVPAGAAAAVAFLQAFQYVNRPKALASSEVKDNTDWDFHQIVGASASLPSLMRALGLVLDLRAGPLSPTIVKELQTANAHKKLLTTEAFLTFDGTQLNWKPIHTPPVAPTNHMTYSVRPPTVCLTDYGIFRARPQDPKKTDHYERMLRLSDSSLFPFVSIDHINAALKARQLGDNVGRSRVKGKKVTPSAADRFPIPSLRTGGFAIARTGRAVQMANILKRQTDALQTGYFGGGKPAPLFEEDITRGYRFDVFSKQITDRWLSLMWRQGDISINGGETLSVTEEDTIVPSTGTAGPDDGTKDLYLSEILSKWDGWSLAVPRVGTPWLNDPSTTPHAPIYQYNVITDWSVPGTSTTTTTNSPNFDADKLPPLRFGINYQMRARLVDLAGNSLSVAKAPTGGPAVTANRKHLRFEPAPAPRVLLVGAPQPGASEEVLVVRSESGTDQHNGGIDSGSATRVIVPGSTSVFMAEQHGAFDVADGSAEELDSSLARYTDIAQRDGTSLTNQSKGTLDPTTVHSQTNPFTFPGFFPIKYLPEYIGKVALVRGLPESTSKLTTAQIPFLVGSGAAWPNLVNGRIVLAKAAPGANNNWAVGAVSGTDPDGDTIPVAELGLTLNVGDMLTCDLNAEISEQVLEQMAMWDIIQGEAERRGLSGSKLSNLIGRLKGQILAGEHWMFTPWRKITFVHAVRTPLFDPVLFLKPTKKSLGQTYAEFDGKTDIEAGTVLFSRKSTARVDVNATWTMPIDTGLNQLNASGTTFSTIEQPSFSGPVFSLDIDRVGDGKIPDSNTSQIDEDGDADNFNQIHQFNDTKFRAVTYQATATSYYIEYFREQLTIPTASATPVQEMRNKPGPYIPGIAFEPETVKVELIGTTAGSELDPLGSGMTLDDPQIVVRPLIEAPLGTDINADPAPGDFVVIVPDASDPTQNQIAFLANSNVKGNEVAGTPTLVMSYVGPTIHSYSHPVADRTTSTTLIPNSKRPDAPDPLYVVPITNRHENNGDPTNVSWTRNALRVYLNRPWWSSGDQERLGVVCWHQSSKTGAIPPTALNPYVTQWGYDPAQKSRLTLTTKTKQPNPSCFPWATSSSSSGTLPIEESSSHVDVAGHNVQYDPDRDLWYADIQVTAPGGAELESYMPFIRFAFARYQPHSITGTHLSKIVTVDYAQIAPNRHVTVVPRAAGGYTVTVTGISPAMTPAGGSKPVPNQIVVTVETRDDRISDDNVAWKPAVIGGPQGLISQGLTPTIASTDQVTWTGVINPSGVPSDAEVRLTFDEREIWDGEARLVWTDSIRLLPT